MSIATAVGAFLVGEVVLLLATFCLGVAILVAVLTVLGFTSWTIVPL